MRCPGLRVGLEGVIFSVERFGLSATARLL
jgi:hypothetical protein